MQSEVKHFCRVNDNLSLIVEDLGMRQRGLEHETQTMRDKLGAQEIEKKRFKKDVVETINHCIGDFKKLKKGVIRLHKVWVL